VFGTFEYRFKTEMTSHRKLKELLRRTHISLRNQSHHLLYTRQGQLLSIWNPDTLYQVNVWLTALLFVSAILTSPNPVTDVRSQNAFPRVDALELVPLALPLGYTCNNILIKLEPEKWWQWSAAWPSRSVGYTRGFVTSLACTYTHVCMYNEMVRRAS